MGHMGKMSSDLPDCLLLTPTHFMPESEETMRGPKVKEHGLLYTNDWSEASAVLLVAQRQARNKLRLNGMATPLTWPDAQESNVTQQHKDRRY